MAPNTTTTPDPSDSATIPAVLSPSIHPPAYATDHTPSPLASLLKRLQHGSARGREAARGAFGGKSRANRVAAQRALISRSVAESA